MKQNTQHCVTEIRSKLKLCYKLSMNAETDSSTVQIIQSVIISLSRFFPSSQWFKFLYFRQKSRL